MMWLNLAKSFRWIKISTFGCLHEESLGPQLPIECTAKTLIRLGAKIILLVLSLGGSNEV